MVLEVLGGSMGLGKAFGLLLVEVGSHGREESRNVTLFVRRSVLDAVRRELWARMVEAESRQEAAETI